MDPDAAKILYLCRKGGPHPAHEHFVTANAEVVAVRPLNMKMVKYLAGRKYDVALADGLSTLPIGYALKRCKLVDKLIFITTSPAFVYRRNIFKKLLPRVDGVIATSSLMASLIKNSFNYKGPVYVCFPIPDLEDFLKVCPSIDSKKACFIGTYGYHKGADLLPILADKLKKEIKEAKIFVIGHKQHYKLNQYRGIEFFGYVSRASIPRLISQCSVYLHPARIEAFGACAIESMAAGLIPVVTDTTGAKDIVRLLDPTLVVKCNVDAIIEKIIEIWSWKHEKRVSLSNKAKKIVNMYAKIAPVVFAKSLKAILCAEENGYVDISSKKYHI
jgi:glycosyltransferase involved in cell wall biosynthesis